MAHLRNRPCKDDSHLCMTISSLLTCTVKISTKTFTAGSKNEESDQKDSDHFDETTTTKIESVPSCSPEHKDLTNNSSIDVYISDDEETDETNLEDLHLYLSKDCQNLLNTKLSRASKQIEEFTSTGKELNRENNVETNIHVSFIIDHVLERVFSYQNK